MDWVDKIVKYVQALNIKHPAEQLNILMTDFTDSHLESQASISKTVKASRVAVELTNHITDASRGVR